MCIPIVLDDEKFCKPLRLSRENTGYENEIDLRKICLCVRTGHTGNDFVLSRPAYDTKE
jgi:hypothetical protein